MESLYSFLKMALGGFVAFVLYFAGKKDQLTDIEKQQLELELLQNLNAQKAREQIDKQAEKLKKAIPNAWSGKPNGLRAQGSKSAMRKAGKA